MTENLTLEIKNLRSIIDFKISLPIKKEYMRLREVMAPAKALFSMLYLKLYTNQLSILILNLMEMKILKLDTVIKIKKLVI